MRHLTYLLSVIVFCGGAMALMLSRAARREKRALRGYEYRRILITVGLVSLPFTLSEYFALRWGAWLYYPESILPIRWGAQFETFMFALCVSVTIATATLLFADRIDRGHAKSRKR